MATLLDTSARKDESGRPVRKARPTGEPFDAKQAHDHTMARYPKVMTRLAE